MVSFPINSYNRPIVTVPNHKITTNMTSIKNAELGWNESGTPVSDQFDDVYFSNVNGLEETRYVFLKKIISQKDGRSLTKDALSLVKPDLALD